MNKQKIIPHLWFNNEVKEAVTFYTNIFPNSSIDQEAIIYGSPGGDADLVSFTIFDYTFMAINGGHNFQKNPSISFTINFYYNGDNSEKKMLIKIWNELASAGKVLMPLQEYSFSKLYGWVEDKFSVSWQLSLIDSKKDINSKRIAPNLMFVDDVCGKAEEATDFYISIFNNSKRKSIHRYPANMEPDKGGTVMYTDLQLEGLLFSATDRARNHQFNFNEGISLLINCDDQDEIDYYWKKLSHD